MAKASKKAAETEQGPSQNGTGGRQRTAARGKSKSAPPPGDQPVMVEVVTTTTEVAAELAPPPGRANLGAIGEVTALTEQLRAARVEAAELLSALKSETAAAAVAVAELRHQCRETSEKLVLEIGEQSLALTRVRQTRDEAAELARGTDDSRAGVRALRQECDQAAAALDTLAGQSRAAFREALEEALDGVRRLRQEIESVRPTSTGSVSMPEPAATAPRTEERKNRFGATVAPGVVVTEVLPDGPADAAGLDRGDVVEEANGRKIHSGSDLREAADAVADGEDITLQISRGGEMLVRTLRLGDGAEGKSLLGVTVGQGLIVADVFPGSAAEGAGLVRGDVIEDVQGQPVQSGDQLHSLLHSQPEGAEVMLVVSRNGQRHELRAHLDGK